VHPFTNHGAVLTGIHYQEPATRKQVVGAGAGVACYSQRRVSRACKSVDGQSAVLADRVQMVMLGETVGQRTHSVAREKSKQPAVGFGADA
jgi:hypothetical protein